MCCIIASAGVKLTERLLSLCVPFRCVIKMYHIHTQTVLTVDCYVFQAVENVLKIGKKFPMDTHREVSLDCFCDPPPLLASAEEFNWTSLDRNNCLVSLLQHHVTSPEGGGVEGKGGKCIGARLTFEDGSGTGSKCIFCVTLRMIKALMTDDCKFVLCYLQ